MCKKSAVLLKTALLLSACTSDPKVESIPSSQKELTRNSGDSITHGSTGQKGKDCWEANFVDSDGDGLPNPEYDSNSDGIPDADINQDGSIDILDCLGIQGPQGITGPAGDDGKDGTNGAPGQNGINGLNGVNCFDGLGDLNNDGVINTADCRGPAGSNGVHGTNGLNGLNGANCYDGLGDVNKDGFVNTADCRGPTTDPQFTALKIIKCKVGDEVPGGVDETGLMNEHFQSGPGEPPIGSIAQCPAGTYLIMSMVTSVKLSQIIIDGNSAEPMLDYGVASGKANSSDPYPTKIECFFANRFPSEVDPAVAGAIAVTGMGVCAPIP